MNKVKKLVSKYWKYAVVALLGWCLGWGMHTCHQKHTKVSGHVTNGCCHK
jgi:hypothetical protein